jgi:hypothetical protein
MLKSELVIPEDLELLESYLKHYSMHFLDNIYSHDNGPDMGGYKKDRIKLLALIATNHQDEARKLLIPQMMSERDLLGKVTAIIWDRNRKIKWDIDPVVMANLLNQIGKLRELIENYCAGNQLTKEMLNEYYEESLVLLVYFNIVRSYIATTRNMYNQFQPHNMVCTLKFNHTVDTSFSITQQKDILVFIEAIFSRFFADYLDILTLEFDTGSPKLDCSIKLNHESKATWDLTKSFSDFFNHLFKSDTAGFVKAHKKISDLLYQEQKREYNYLQSMKNELPQAEYEKLLVESYQSCTELRRKNILAAVENSRYIQIEDTTPLQIEDPSQPLLPDKT